MGILSADIGRLFLIGLPALLAGTWLGWKLYGRLDEAAFRKIVVYVVLVSGVALVAIVDRGKPTGAAAVPASAAVVWTRTPDVSTHKAE